MDSPAPIALERSSSSPQPLIAHCGMEGCPVSAGQLMSSTSPAKTCPTSASNSLWGNLILSIAFQRDPELQHITQKLGQVDTLTLTSVAAISALGLAQGLDTLATLNDDPHRKSPVALGLIGTSTSLASLTARVYFGNRYKRQIAQRQAFLTTQVETILSALKSGDPFSSIRGHLSELIGVEATGEFATIWSATHLQQ